MQRWIKHSFSKAESIAGRDFYSPSYLIAVHLAIHEKAEHNQLRHANHKCGILRHHVLVYLAKRCMAIFIQLLEANMTAPFVFRTSISFLVACLAADFALTDSAVIVPIRLLEHFPVFSANIGGEPVLLQFDSGNSGSVALTQAVIDKL